MWVAARAKPAGLMRMHATDASATAVPDPARDRVAEVYISLGRPPEQVAERLVSAQAVARLLHGAASGRVLVVGGDIGIAVMVAALAEPAANFVVVDPDLPLAQGAAGRPADEAAETSLALAAAAARRLGVADRVRFLAGGFSASEVTASTLAPAREKTRVIGPRVCAEQGPFARIIIDGLATTEATTNDIRLAASALSPEGVMAVRGCVGERGAAIRAGVFEFLRYNPDYAFSHPPHAWPDEAPGALRVRRNGQTQAAGAPPPSLSAREAMAGLVGLALADRPLLEVVVGSPLLGAERRARGLPVRTLRLTAQDWGARYFDPLIDQILAALDHAPGSALFSGDLLDVAPDELAAKLFARLADRKAPALFGVTPPGEQGVAGIMSRPAARVIDLASGQGLTPYGFVGQEIEAARHRRDGAEESELGATSRYASLILLAGREGWRDARGRSFAELTPAAAAQREQVELQRIHVQAVLRAKLDREAEAARGAGRERDAARMELVAATDAAGAARRSYEAELARLRAEVQRLAADIASVTGDRDRFVEDLRRETQSRRAIEVRIPWLEEEIERLSQLHAKETGRLNQLHAEAAAARDALDVEAADERKRRIAAEARRMELEHEADRVARQFAEAAAARDDLAAKLAAERSRRDALEADLGARLAAAETAHGALQEASQREIGALNAKLAIAAAWERSTLASIETLKSAHGGAIAKFSESEAALAAAAATAARERDELRSELGAMKADLARTRGQLAEAQADLGRARSDLDAGRRRLREREGDLSSALSGKSGAEVRLRDLQAELDKARVAAARHETAVAEARSESVRQGGEAASLRSLLADMQARSATTAEAFAPLDVEGLDAHLTLAQRAIDQFQAGQALTDPSGVRYPGRPDLPESGAAETSADLAARLRRLHGRAADLSRDVYMLLSAASQADEESEAIRRREIAARETSHAEAVERLRQDVAHRLSAYEHELGEIGRPLAAAERATRELKRVVLNGAADPPPATDVPPASGFAARIAALSAGIETIQHIMDARRLAAREAENAKAQSFAAATWLKPAVTAVTPTAASSGPLPGEAAPRRKEGFLGPVKRGVRTYFETVRLVDLRSRINRELALRGLAARLFDPDVYRLSGAIEPMSDPLRHYLEQGEAEGRRPLALFDPAYYRANNPDAALARRSLLAHFFGAGLAQGRAPCAELSTLPAMADEAGMSMLEFFVRSEQKAAQAAKTGAKAGRLRPP